MTDKNKPGLPSFHETFAYMIWDRMGRTTESIEPAHISLASELEVIFQAQVEHAEQKGKETMREQAAQEAANAFLIHDMPRPEIGPFTLQQRSADEARTQIAEKIRAISIKKQKTKARKG